MTVTLAILALLAVGSFHLSVIWGVDWRVTQKTVDPSSMPPLVGSVLMVKHLLAAVITLVLIILIVNGGKWPSLA